MTSQFNPPAGKLISRILISPGGRAELVIAFRDREDAFPHHYRSVARIMDYVAEPYFSGYYETTREAESLYPMVHMHYTTWEELCAVVRTWDSRVAITDWLDEVREIEKLASDQKERISRAIAAERGEE